MNEHVDILEPPDFKPSGVVKTRDQAQKDGDWIGTFNLWILTRLPEPAIIYQQRSLKKDWAPGKLDVAAGGHYTSGESLLDGLREASEELGVDINSDHLKPLGKKLHVSKAKDGTMLYTAVDMYLAEESWPLKSYKLQKEEVDAIVALPVAELLKVHRNEHYSFSAVGLDSDQTPLNIKVVQSSFPVNLDRYHYKMAVLADRYFKGDLDLLY
jgi:hypothetical protein